MPHIVCAIPFPYPLPARSTLPWPRASLDISALDQSLEIAQPVASETVPAGPRPGAVRRSAPFRNTVDLQVHVSRPGGPNGICHLVGQYLQFPLNGTAFRT